MKEIGGYFELELPRGAGCHHGAISVNNGRNGLAVILGSRNIEVLHVPFYICDSIISQIIECGVECSFYPINSGFLPEGDLEVRDNDAVLYVNYFGVNDRSVGEFIETYGREKAIIDNSQAFYSQPVDDVDTFYSARKFFGVADGGYVYAASRCQEELELDSSVDRCRHLLGRLDANAMSYYDDYKKNEELHNSLTVMKMSKLTESILGSIDHDKVIATRKSNFKTLHEMVGSYNNLRLSLGDVGAPMVYPLLLDCPGLKEFLLEQRVFVPTYWQEVLGRINREHVHERRYVEDLLCLPIDQRYACREMQQIGELIEEYVAQSSPSGRK